MLVGKMVELALMAIVILAVTTLFSFTYKTIQKGEQFSLSLERKLYFKNLVTDHCVQHEVYNHPKNTSIHCLFDNSCKNQDRGELLLVDRDKKILTVETESNSGLYTRDLQPCLENCEYKLDVTYQIDCGEPCNRPLVTFIGEYIPINNIKADLRVIHMQEQTVYKPVYQSCQHALADGNTSDGLYYLTVKHAQYPCPIQVYCRMSDGLGSALVVNAPNIDYETLKEVAPPLQPASEGRLSQELIETLSENKILSVDVFGTTEGNIGFQLNTPSSALSLFNGGTLTSCLDSKANGGGSTIMSSDQFGLVSTKGDATVGFSWNIDDPEGSLGFHCRNCNTNSTCGMPTDGCCKSKMRGALWAH